MFLICAHEIQLKFLLECYRFRIVVTPGLGAEVQKMALGGGITQLCFFRKKVI